MVKNNEKYPVSNGEVDKSTLASSPTEMRNKITLIMLGKNNKNEVYPIKEDGFLADERVDYDFDESREMKLVNSGFESPEEVIKAMKFSREITSEDKLFSGKYVSKHFDTRSPKLLFNPENFECELAMQHEFMEGYKTATYDGTTKDYLSQPELLHLMQDILANFGKAKDNEWEVTKVGDTFFVNYMLNEYITGKFIYHFKIFKDLDKVQAFIKDRPYIIGRAHDGDYQFN